MTKIFNKTIKYPDINYTGLEAKPGVKDEIAALDPNQDGILKGNERASLEANDRQRLNELHDDNFMPIYHNTENRSSTQDIEDARSKDLADALGLEGGQGFSEGRAISNVLRFRYKQLGVDSSVVVGATKATEEQKVKAESMGVQIGPTDLLIALKDEATGHEIVCTVDRDSLWKDLEYQDAMGKIQVGKSYNEEASISSMAIMNLGVPNGETAWLQAEALAQCCVENAKQHMNGNPDYAAELLESAEKMLSDFAEEKHASTARLKGKISALKFLMDTVAKSNNE